VVSRGEIFWADLPEPAGRRPVCVVTRDAAIEVLTSITCAPITRTIRGIRSEVEIGRAEGVPDQCAISCDNLLTVAKTSLGSQAIGALSGTQRAQLDIALRFALDILY
jgi:mRNA interferase MazF